MPLPPALGPNLTLAAESGVGGGPALGWEASRVGTPGTRNPKVGEGAMAVVGRPRVDGDGIGGRSQSQPLPLPPPLRFCSSCC
jgi:hypothetical protein